MAEALSASSTSVVMPGRQSLRLVPTQHHHFRLIDGLVCKSVHAALLRPVQRLQRCLASASQVLVSALERRHGRYAVSFIHQRDHVPLFKSCLC